MGRRLDYDDEMNTSDKKPFDDILHERLAYVMDVGYEISRIQDLDVLLERVLQEARALTNADAGSIYIREDEDSLTIKYSQNETLERRLGPNRKLIYSTFKIPVDNNTVSGYVANTGEIVNIEDVYALGEEVPYRFNPEYDRKSGYRTRSMLAFPLISQGKRVIGVLQLINARKSGGQIKSFDRLDEPLIRHFATSAAIAVERAMMTREIILRMIDMVGLHDPKETGAHCNRVAAYAVEIYGQWARNKGMDESTIQRGRDVLRMAAMLHDVGKIAISDVILKKPGKLTDEEFEAMKSHTWLGARIFRDRWSDFDEAAYGIALNHHERWDGRGYPGHVDPVSGTPIPGHERSDGKPTGKKGEEIPVFARVVAVADVYDALSSRRCYKEAWDEARVLDIFVQERGKHFDPSVVDAFFQCIDVLKSIKERYPDSED